jgi:cbb3-type cytochrome oxidase cytochrome c subunit
MEAFEPSACPIPTRTSPVPQEAVPASTEMEALIAYLQGLGTAVKLRRSIT